MNDLADYHPLYAHLRRHRSVRGLRRAEDRQYGDSPDAHQAGGRLLLSVPGIHPAIQLIAVEANSCSGARRAEPFSFHSTVECRALDAAILRRLCVSQVRRFCRGCSHGLSYLVTG